MSGEHKTASRPLLVLAVLTAALAFASADTGRAEGERPRSQPGARPRLRRRAQAREMHPPVASCLLLRAPRRGRIGRHSL